MWLSFWRNIFLVREKLVNLGHAEELRVLLILFICSIRRTCLLLLSLFAPLPHGVLLHAEPLEHLLLRNEEELVQVELLRLGRDVATIFPLMVVFVAKLYSLKNFLLPLQGLTPLTPREVSLWLSEVLFCVERA